MSASHAERQGRVFAPIVGYTTRRHLLVDLDNCTLTKAKGIARLVMERWNKVGDCLILRSSEGSHRITMIATAEPGHVIEYNRDNYMLVFDGQIGYNLCCKILETLAGLDVLNEAFMEIRLFRGDLTLRVSPKEYGDRYVPIPEPVSFVVNPWTVQHDGLIDNFLEALEISKRLFQEKTRPWPSRESQSPLGPFLLLRHHLLSRIETRSSVP